MKIKFRTGALRRMSLAALLATAVAVPVSAQTLSAVLHTSLRVLDPHMTTAYMTRNHGYMIYDTLLGVDATGKIQPQMLENWAVSADGKTYTFTLREGLRWHDGAPVTSADCIASYERWSQVDKMGQVLRTLVSRVEAIDARSFRVVQTEASDLVLRSFAKISGSPLFIMPERVARTPGSEAIKEHVGSGPFRFVSSEFRPGVKVVYEKNKDYVPRKEPASWTAGAKVVEVDRVEWLTMPDHQTSVNALVNGEIDYMESVPFDLLPQVDGEKAIKVDVINTVGYQAFYRFNHLHAPFNDKRIRQAAMYAVRQQDILKAQISNPKYYQACAAIFGCGLPLESDAGTQIIKGSDLDKAKALLKEAGYDGTPVLIMHPTDVASQTPQTLVISQSLRRAGFNVTMQASDWASIVKRRAVKDAPAQGGWNLFSTNFSMLDITDPLRSAMVAANGGDAWFGWPNQPRIEALRQRFALSGDAAEQKRIADEVQQLVLEEGVYAPIGQFVTPSAYRTVLSEVPKTPMPFFWGIRKTGK